MCLTKYYGLKKCGGVNVYSNVSFKSVLHGSEWLDSRLGHFTAGEIARFRLWQQAGPSAR
jgi:hypothetical protein